jgi:hypothetical protein
MALTTVAMVGAGWVSAGAASALDLGPVSLPVPVTVPAGPAQVVDTLSSETLPNLGVDVGASPTTGVGITVTPPSALGPVPLPAGDTPPIQVTIGGGGVITGVGTLPLSSPQPGGRTQTSPGPFRSATPTPITHSSINKPPFGVSMPAVPAATSGATGNPAASQIAPPPARTLDGNQAVSATLRESGPQATLAFLQKVASRAALWIALFAILGLARWALAGLVRDWRARASTARAA